MPVYIDAKKQEQVNAAYEVLQAAMLKLATEEGIPGGAIINALLVSAFDVMRANGALDNASEYIAATLANYRQQRAEQVVAPVN